MNILHVFFNFQESLISGPNNTPLFIEVWAPLDGFVFNFGLELKL